jgi:RimJ/RimL family protein N-acetyltransferase
VLVRALTPDDLGAYRALHRHALTHAPTAFAETCAQDEARSDDVVAAFLARGDAWGVFAADGALIGKLLIDAAPYAAFAHTRWLHAVYVHPDARGAGAAAALIRGATEHVRKDGVFKVLLWVHTENAQARAFYEKLGFREVGRISQGILIAGRYIDDVMMCLELSRS